jgi:hypothetical protein
MFSKPKHHLILFLFSGAFLFLIYRLVHILSGLQADEMTFQEKSSVTIAASDIDYKRTINDIKNTFINRSNEAIKTPKYSTYFSTLMDTDGDGVDDSIDIDDDGDGILDIVENSCEVNVDTPAVSPTAVQGLSFVDGIYTDFNNNGDDYWESFSTAINPVEPNSNFNLIAFEVGGNTFATGVDNDRLTDSDNDNLFDGLDRDNNGTFEQSLVETSWNAIVSGIPFAGGVILEGSALDGNTATRSGPILNPRSGPYNSYLFQPPPWSGSSLWSRKC